MWQILNDYFAINRVRARNSMISMTLTATIIGVIKLAQHHPAESTMVLAIGGLLSLIFVLALVTLLIFVGGTLDAWYKVSKRAALLDMSLSEFAESPEYLEDKEFLARNGGGLWWTKN